MPRKFRPPTKRRKTRDGTIPYDFEGARPVTTPDGPLDEEAPMLAIDVADPEAEPEDRPMQSMGSARGARHVARDYSYVRGEIVQIFAIAAFLIVALSITAVLR